MSSATKTLFAGQGFQAPEMRDTVAEHPGA
jgi:hypothetical protein